MLQLLLLLLLLTVTNETQTELFLIYGQQYSHTAHTDMAISYTWIYFYSTILLMLLWYLRLIYFPRFDMSVRCGTTRNVRCVLMVHILCFLSSTENALVRELYV